MFNRTKVQALRLDDDEYSQTKDFMRRLNLNFSDVIRFGILLITDHLKNDCIVEYAGPRLSVTRADGIHFFIDTTFRVRQGRITECVINNEVFRVTFPVAQRSHKSAITQCLKEMNDRADGNKKIVSYKFL